MTSDHRAPASAFRLMGAAVLIVEDEPIIALEIQVTLQDRGCAVLGPAETVQQALFILSQERPDAALLDVSLLDGRVAPVAVALTAAGVPFALMTAHGDAELDDDCLAAVPRVTKPYGTCAIEAMVDHLLTAVQPCAAGPPAAAPP